MSFDHDPKSPFDRAMRLEAAADTGEVRVFVVLPTLDVLLNTPAFGGQSPISLPGTRAPADGWSQFGSVRARGFKVH